MSQASVCPDAPRLIRLLRSEGLTLDEAASRLGLESDECVQQLRLLALPDSLLRAISAAGLTRRHALALLRVQDSRLREAALTEMAYLSVPPEEAERYVDAILSPAVPPPVRDFLSALSRDLEDLSAAGIDAELTRDDADNLIKLTLRLPIT